MIPKTIHYCWFGNNPLPKSALKCIESWKKFLPEYEIKEWNESNFDVNMIPYIREAYQAKKFAFVSDYARLYILYHEGGIYFDTDVEVVGSMDHIIKQGSFMGCEVDGYLPQEVRDKHKTKILVNPGLGMGAVKNLEVLKSILNIYENINFINDDGSFNTTTIVRYTTKVLFEYGLEDINEIQTVNNIVIYPSEYFNPLDDSIGKLTKTSNTVCIHWYSKSWISRPVAIRSKIIKKFRKYLGKDFINCIKNRSFLYEKK